MTIHLSAWQDAPWPEVVDCIIVDPPYSARVHKGHDAGKRAGQEQGQHSSAVRPLAYDSLTPADVQSWGSSWARRARQWVAVMTDHHLVPIWQDTFTDSGLYAFSPVPCVITGMTVRLSGDGPSSWTVYLMVARTKAASKWGTLPGAYVVPHESGRANDRIGGKPLSLMRQIVRDYSRPGMVVADPCCGHGTTLVAAAEQGREVWGCDTDAESVRRTRERLTVVQAQPQLFEAATQLEIL